MTGFFNLNLPRLTDKSTDSLFIEYHLMNIEDRPILTNQGIPEFLIGSELDVRGFEVPTLGDIIPVYLADAGQAGPYAAHHVSLYGDLGRDLVFPAD